MNTALAKLQKWFLTNCDGEWEGEWSIAISTTDKPGWVIKIPLHETLWANKNFNTFDYCNDDESKWIHCEKNEGYFDAWCDSESLEELIDIFISWIEDK